VQDNELIASFEPKTRGWVLVMAFDDLGEALIEQERIQALHREDRDEEGAALPQVETLFLGPAQYGERKLMAGGITTGLLVASTQALNETAEARRDWARQRMQRSSVITVKRGVSAEWAPTNDQMDMLERWAEDVLEPDPAGNEGWTRRIKVSVAREGFRQFALDRDRPDLAFEGSNGGKAFSAALQAMFSGAAAVRRSEAGHPYVHGLRRKDGANRRYFRLP
jgi:hypothetical protein